MNKYPEGVIDLKDTVLLITTLTNFLKYKPPCKQCLIQGMCIREMTGYAPTYLIVKICGKLKKFLIDNKKIIVEEDELVKLERMEI